MWPKTIGFLILSAWLCGISQADIFEDCGERDNMYISIGDNCSHYIFCYGDESFEGDCDVDAPYFSEVDQTCDSNPQVCKTVSTSKPVVVAPSPNEPSVELPFVPDGDVDQPELPNVPLQPDQTVVHPVVPSNPPAPSALVTVPSSIVSTAISPVSSVAPISSTSLTPPTPPPSTKAPSVPIPTPTAVNNIAAKCPAVDDPSKIVFLQHTKSCGDYFMCYHGEPLPMHCSNMLHFNIKSLKCDYPENVQCQLDSASPREKCQVHTVDVYPHPFNCNYYYLCNYGYLMVMQCPLNMDWDYKMRVCVLRRKAECYASME